jgi:predicted nuclease with TOPRIM domain
MNGIQHKIPVLKDLIKQEIEKLDELAGAENKLQKCVLDKNWAELEEIIRRLQCLSAEISHIENSRNILYGEILDILGVIGPNGFYDVLAKLRSEERVDLAALYRRLRLSVNAVRSITGGIDTYITATISTMGRILEELFPARRMRLYNKSGTSRKAEHPMVFSRCL